MTTINIDDKIVDCKDLSSAKSTIMNHLNSKKKKGHKIKAYRLGSQATENNYWTLVDKDSQEVAFGKIYN